MASTFICVIALAFLSWSNSLPTVFKLERATRQQRITSGVANFTLEGSTDLHKYGYYFTKVKIGSPAREYRLTIDTASDKTWVSCAGCDNCPTFNRHGFQLQLYNPNSSSSSSVISCLDKKCPHSPTDFCNSRNPRCNYAIIYEDESESRGFYVSDVVHLDTIMDGSASTTLSFGCSKNTSKIVSFNNTVDGVLALDTGNMSWTSQLSVQKFSHCLSGKNAGGGVLVLGEIQDPRIVYTPLYLSENYYIVNIRSIALGGKIVQINPAIFGSENRGAVVDSATTVIVLAPGLYDPVINSLTAAVSSFALSVKREGFDCFVMRPRFLDKFPEVSFNLEGNVSMTVQPEDYLMWMSDKVGFDSDLLCLLFGKGEHPDSTVLGEVLLQNKIVVYDIARQQLGWVKHDCTQPFNISSDTSACSSLKAAVLVPRITSILIVFLYLVMFG